MTSAPRSARSRPAMAPRSPAGWRTRWPARSASFIVPLAPPPRTAALIDLTLVSDYCDQDRPEPSPAREEARHDQLPHRRRRLSHPRAARHLPELAAPEHPDEAANS